MALLELSNVTMKFGGLTAIDNLDISVSKGEIFSIIGPNGAGKTTVFNVITGIYHPTCGQIQFKSNDISRKSADRIVRAGIARTFQNIRLFNNMTVLENVLLGQHIHFPGDFFSALFHLPNYCRSESIAYKRAIDLLAFFGPNLVAHKDDYAMNLSYADRRRVEIVRALGANPSLLLLDEPTAGMNDAETVDAIKDIQRLRHNFDLTILLIEHKLQVTMGISDRIAVLDYGKKIAEGNPSEIRSNELVIEAYLGCDTEVNLYA
jgi:branched-chain amino acid transport system ATP-binding protein